MNIDSNETTVKQQTPVTHSGRGAAFYVNALFRLALLVGPMAILVIVLWHNPFICALLCLAVLFIWLSVDVGPFRANRSAKAVERETPRPAHRNITKLQWWSCLFCRIVVFFALFHSKLTI